ncbi:YdcF family protein [Vallitalea guaymasensis]|uniref:YdcF family protein n=1 Tax=Vallitalea guaymasensis TaxID=1185412 RepID=UPI002729EEA9|nr:YdcF family protein [Vallitalea guaymasensis]
MGLLAILSLVIGGFSILYFLFLTILNAGAGFSFFWILLSVMAFCMFFIFRNYEGVKEHVPKLIRYVVFLLIIIVIMIFIVVQSFIIKDSIKRDNYDSTDYVIVLGARVKGTTISLTLSHRLEIAYKYLIDNTTSKAILAGGKGPGEDISEAEAMKRYLLNKGINEDRLIMENKSTSTQENIRNSFELINAYNDAPSVTIITSDFHVYRAKKIAEKYCQDIQGIPSRTHPPLIVHYYVREFFAVLKDTVF